MVMRRAMISFVFLAGCAANDPAAPPRAELREENAIEAHLYPTELVLDHQNEIGLSESQRTHIRDALQSTQRDIVEVELALRRDREELASALAPAEVDQARALPIAERVADGERELKLLHLRLLVSIKNELTPEQQAHLDRLR
jgi:Spy/CpxP family protein refolding chaperone